MMNMKEKTINLLFLLMLLAIIIMLLAQIAWV